MDVDVATGIGNEASEDVIIGNMRSQKDNNVRIVVKGANSSLVL